jgi:hypothetical protein
MKKLFTLISVLALSKLSAQTTVTLSPAGSGGQDAYLASGTPTNNFGNHPEFGANACSCGGTLCLARGVMQIDMSTIPVNAIVMSANLYLSCDVDITTPTYTTGTGGTLSKNTAAWTESLVTWATQPSTTSVGQVAIATPTASNQAQDYTVNISGMAQSWITTPASNFGFTFRGNDESAFYKRIMFSSSDHTTTARQPKVIITYSVPSVGISESIQENNVSLFPNPSNNVVTVKGIRGERTFVLTDIAGRELRSGNISEEISVAELANGIYFILIETEYGYARRKLIRSE